MLPSLDKNIVHDNSLIGWDIHSYHQAADSIPLSSAIPCHNFL